MEGEGFGFEAHMLTRLCEIPLAAFDRAAARIAAQVPRPMVLIECRICRAQYRMIMRDTKRHRQPTAKFVRPIDMNMGGSLRLF